MQSFFMALSHKWKTCNFTFFGDLLQDASLRLDLPTKNDVSMMGLWLLLVKEKVSNRMNNINNKLLNMHCFGNLLTLPWQWSLWYKNQSIDLQSKSMDWFLYDRDLRHERVNLPANDYIKSLPKKRFWDRIQNFEASLKSPQLDMKLKQIRRETKKEVKTGLTFFPTRCTFVSFDQLWWGDFSVLMILISFTRHWD